MDRSRFSTTSAAAMICCGLLWGGLFSLSSACTTIAVGKNASADGSTMTTHNADCLDCDFRLGRVPAHDWPPGSKRPVIKFRAQYPRTVAKDRGMTWTADNLDPELPQRSKWLNESWQEARVLGYIPQVEHTFAYLEGLYGIINENQVAIGESTCGAKWFSGPISDNSDCDECNSLFDVSELSRVALERASTAREAILIMGEIGVEHGFYGSVWTKGELALIEAGEALTVTDPTEAWIFHIMPDHTTKSAVWVAQRVPDDHISVVANQFTIKEVHPDADPNTFMFSANLFQEAEQAGVGYELQSGLPVHFGKVFGVKDGNMPGYSTRRVWRGMDIIAPSLGLSPYVDTITMNTMNTTDHDQEYEYPFSVKPDKPVTTQDIMAIMRDNYEGTIFDLTKGIAAGPYGDEDRYDVARSLDGSTTQEEAYSSSFERSISMFRTSYTTVTQSRSHLPDEVGALLWFSQYKPSMSTFIPLYVSIDEVPRPYTVGSLFRFSNDSSYWVYSVVGNWASRFRRFAHEDVAVQQTALEGPLFETQAKLEGVAADLVRRGDIQRATAKLTKHSQDSAEAAVSTFRALFDTLVARYPGGYQLEDPKAETINTRKIFYPKWWLEAVGFFHTRQADVAGINITSTEEPYAPPCPDDHCDGDKSPFATATNLSGLSRKEVVIFVVGAILFTLLGVEIGRWSTT